MSWFANLLGRTAATPADDALALSRRAFMTGGFLRQAAAPAAAPPRPAFPVLRPPGAIAEAGFLAGCTRCGDCNIGSYRLRGKCRTCPNTAWLLLLSFFLAITAFVAVGVWMSKKNINLAGLAIGVVCGGACATDVPEHYVSCGALSAGASP